MNPELKEEWLYALRSDEHFQIKGCLENKEGGQCCLGVLCEIMGADSVVGWSGDREYGAVLYDDNLPKWDPQDVTEEADTELNERLRKEADLSFADMNFLMLVNDEKGWTFDQIADWIEVNL